MWCSGMGKKNTLRWFVILRKKKVKSFLRKCMPVKLRVLGGPVVRWKDRVREYMHGRGVDRGIEQARRDYLDRERWRLFCHSHSLWGTFPQGTRRQKL